MAIVFFGGLYVGLVFMYIYMSHRTMHKNMVTSQLIFDLRESNAKLKLLYRLQGGLEDLSEL